VAKVKAPVLVIHGTDDEVIDFSHGIGIYERFYLNLLKNRNHFANILTCIHTYIRKYIMYICIFNGSYSVSGRFVSQSITDRNG